MAERRIINGYIVERGDDGQIRTAGRVDSGQGGGMPVDPSYPFEGKKAAADVQGSQLDNQYKQVQIQEAQSGKLPTGYRRTADGGAELIPGVPAPKDPNSPAMTAAERANAIAGYQSSLALEKVISQLEEQYAQGPGATSGLAGVQDYFPTEINNQFDSTGNAARGTVGQALGFTGGQLNSVQEAQMAVGPYLPQSSDRDAVILDKIARLKQVRDDARARSIAMLGGIPDVNGRVAPVEQMQGVAGLPQLSYPGEGSPLGVDGGPVSYPDARRAQGDNVRPASGASVVAAGEGQIRSTGLEGLGQELLKMVQAGVPRNEVISYADKRYKDVGYPGAFPEQVRALDYAVQMRAKNPSKLVTDFVKGWENFEMVPDSQASPGARAMGAAATWEPAGVPVGNTATHFFNAASVGVPTSVAGDNGADVIAASRRTMPGSSMVGDVGGSIAAMAGINKLGAALAQTGSKAAQLAGRALAGGGGIGGDVAYNATRGGIENGPTGAVIGGIAGAVGNKVGSGIVNTAGRAARGISNPAVNYLASRGVPMTAGQLLGNRGIFGRTMSKLESMPVIGDSLAARRMSSFETFNRAAAADAGRPIGYSPSSGGLAAIEGGLNASGRAIDDATAGVSVQLDEQFQRELADALARGEALPPDFAQKFALVNRNKVQPGISSGSLSGDEYAQMTRGIKGYRAEHQKSGFEGDYRDALSEVQSALDGAVARGAGSEVLENLGKARTAYRDFKLLQNASERGQGGAQSGTPEMFTPAQLQGAVRSSKYAQNGTNAPFYELTKSGQEVLPSTLPNSGTADRGLAGLLLPATLGGGAVAANQYLDPKLAAPLALLAALSSKTGAKVAQKALTGRGPTARAIGTKLINQRRKAGLFGASAASSMVPQLTQ